MEEYVVDITINNYTNKGKAKLNERGITLQVSNKDKIIFYNNIKNYVYSEDSGIIITLSNNMDIMIKGSDNKKIFNYIDSTIKSNINKNTTICVHNDIIKSPYVYLLIGFLLPLILKIVFPQLKNGLLLGIFIGFILIIVSLIKIVINFYKDVTASAYNQNVREQFLRKLAMIGLPIFFFVITIVYQSTGPVGAVNDALGGSFASCKNEGKSDGITSYTCFSKGYVCDAECKENKCVAHCSWNRR